jgi:streptomycin 6-kinase
MEEILMTHIPYNFARTMIELYGAEGVTWLQRLPLIIDECARRWSLTVMPPFSNLSYNYVAPAQRADGLDVVLKVGFPHRELLTEIAALRCYNGRGIAYLLETEPEQGALLLERLTPGTMLVQIEDDEQATAIAADVMRQLWRPAPPDHLFPTVADWAAGLVRLRAEFDGGTGPFPTALVEQAEQLFAELLISMAEPVLLHGDLHHYNILAAERQPWLAIDPKGVIGEPVYETGTLLRDPINWFLTHPDPRRVLARRIDQLAEMLQFDRARIRGWGLAQAVLSGWWSYEDSGHGWEPMMILAEHLAALPG